MILDEKSLSEAMSRKCGLCGAKAGEPCVNICQKPPQPLTDPQGSLLPNRAQMNGLCPVCKRVVFNDGANIWRHRDKAGNNCPMSGQRFELIRQTEREVA